MNQRKIVVGVPPVFERQAGPLKAILAGGILKEIPGIFSDETN
jgi:hypothetical protein